MFDTLTQRDLAPSTVGLFVGCGGLDFGFQEQGFSLLWSNELSPDAASSYEQLTQHQVNVGDIWKAIDSIPEAEVIIGGPPCQAFSLVGKRLDQDPRAELVFAYFESVKKLRPSAFVMENVPGILASSINGVKLIDYLQGQYRNLGYDVTLLKVNAADYGVPQRRKRVFLVGTRGLGRKFSMVAPDVFKASLGLAEITTASDALSDLPSPVSRQTEFAAYRTNPMGPFQRMMRGASKQVSLHQMPTMSKLDQEFVRHIPPGGNYTSIPDAISTSRIMRIKSTGGRTTTYGRLHPDQPGYTLNTYFNRPNVGANYHYEEERLITVREAMRIQSFPDWFTPTFTNQRSLHMQVGNAVPPLLARAVAKSVVECFKK